VPGGDDRWLDQDAGPVVRPYALVGGRTRPAGETFDLISMITAVRGAAGGLDELELPLGVVKILLSDLRQRNLIAVHDPVPARLTDPQLLRKVADGLRRL